MNEDNKPFVRQLQALILKTISEGADPVLILGDLQIAATVLSLECAGVVMVRHEEESVH